jgi:hypothetical protein
MDGILDQLLRLESAKHRALIESNAADYEANVRAQLRLVDDNPGLPRCASEAPGQAAVLSKLIRLNTALVLNLISASPVLRLIQTAYTREGSPEELTDSRFSVEV